MIKLTQLNDSVVYVRPEAILAVVPSATGCTVFCWGVQSTVKESALHVYTLVKNAEKRSTRTSLKSTTLLAATG